MAKTPDTVESIAFKTAIAPVAGVDDPADVVPSDLGLGSLSPIVVFTVAAAANDLAASGGEVTGASVAEHIKTNPDGTSPIFPDGATLTCGAAAAYPSVCDLTLFAGEYVGDGAIEIIEGLESFDVTRIPALMTTGDRVPDGRLRT